MNETIEYHVQDEAIVAHEKQMMGDGWEPLDARECHFPNESCVTYYWMRQVEVEE